MYDLVESELLREGVEVLRRIDLAPLEKDHAAFVACKMG
jgi:fibrillarin-like rRNA methylase